MPQAGFLSRTDQSGGDIECFEIADIANTAKAAYYALRLLTLLDL